jgi:CelD/BcsL family acetyltransferase involved in cellulose biosynthesis
LIDMTEMVGDRHGSVATLKQSARPAAASREVLVPISAIDPATWRDLAARAIEPNGYYLPEWELAVNASARGRKGVAVLTAGSGPLLGLLPVTTLWRACQIPLPALVSADPYGSLEVPLLDRARAIDAAVALLDAARTSGARALLLRNLTLDGEVCGAFTKASARKGIAPLILQSHARACLDATQGAEQLLRDALGAKKLKELRRQRNRLAEHGTVAFDVASSPSDVARAVETFLTLESSGWKARRGTALAQHEGDARFIRAATGALAAHGQCQIVTLRAGAKAIAAGIVLRHQDRAFFFKLGIDETFARCSPGVQLTIDLTRHLCADRTITAADSTAAPGHPMIEPIWRGRLRIGDVLIPLRANDPVVTSIRSALTLRSALRAKARRLVHAVRQFKEKSS